MLSMRWRRNHFLGKCCGIGSWGISVCRISVYKISDFALKFLLDQIVEYDVDCNSMIMLTDRVARREIRKGMG